MTATIYPAKNNWQLVTAMLTDGTLVLCVLLFMHENWEDWMKNYQNVKILPDLQQNWDYSHLQFPLFFMFAHHKDGI